ncbi:MAG: beta-galactosidase, partial [Terracidiphilus sp.]
MRKICSFSLLSFAMIALLCSAAGRPQQSISLAPAPSTEAFPDLPNVLYGVAYYSEYEPYDRLNKDVALMKAAGLNVVRMGESTWSLWEPEDGQFDYA